MHENIERVLYDEEAIQRGIDQVASRITADYQGLDLTVVSVLKGSCIFVADLIRRLPIPLELSFVAARSYGDGTVSRQLEIDLLPCHSEIEGRHILLVDDILDTGQTVNRLDAELRKRGASDVRTCVFLDKPARRSVDFDADYRVFEVENTFVVGYGLDYAGRYRNLPYVGALRAECIAAVEGAK